MNIGALVISYKRFQYLESIISKINDLKIPCIYYQNLTNDKSNSYMKVKNILQRNINNTNNIYVNPPVFLNAGKSISYAINYASNKFDYVLIIEDDIDIKKLSIDIINEACLFINKENNIATISLYSPYKNNSQNINDYSLIKSNYTHSWGWILKSSVWKSFNPYCEPLKHIPKFNIFQFNLFLRKYAYCCLASLAAKGLIDTWDYQWNVFCQSKNFIHYKVFPSITYHLGNKDTFATNSRNSSQVDNLQLEKYEIHEIGYKKLKILNPYCDLDLELLVNHHNLNLTKSLFFIILNHLPISISIYLFKIIRKFLLKYR